MEEKDFQVERDPAFMAIAAVVHALAKKAMADPTFSDDVTRAILEITEGNESDVAPRVNALARLLTGER